jgi:hypothetical protein
MTTKVLLCGEGPTDYGNRKYGSTEWEEGSLQPIIRKSFQGKDVNFCYATKSEVKSITIQSRTSAKLKGYGVKSFKLCEIARRRENINNIICYVDGDRDPGSRNSELAARKRVQEINDDIKNGFNQFSEDRSRSSIPMVPCKMIESWLLADNEVFQKCFGSVPISPALPQHPELIWGAKDDPGSDYPKHYLKRVLDQYYLQPNREIFKIIAENIDIGVLRNKCPISFERFYTDIQAII